MKDPETGRMVRIGNQKVVAATFRHDIYRKCAKLTTECAEIRYFFTY